MCPKDVGYGSGKKGSQMTIKHGGGGLITTTKDRRPMGNKNVVYSDQTYKGRKMARGPMARG